MGSTIQNEVEAAGQKKQKGEGRIIAARQRALNKFLGKGKDSKPQFADPSALFS